MRTTQAGSSPAPHAAVRAERAGEARILHRYSFPNAPSASTDERSSPRGDLTADESRRHLRRIPLKRPVHTALRELLAQRRFDQLDALLKSSSALTAHVLSAVDPAGPVVSISQLRGALRGPLVEQILADAHLIPGGSAAQLTVASSRHDSEVSLIAVHIGRTLCPGHLAEVHFAALMHDIGRRAMPKLFQDLRTINDEHRTAGTTHTEVGGALLGALGVCTTVTDAVKSHHRRTPPIEPVSQCVWWAERIVADANHPVAADELIALAPEHGLDPHAIDMLLLLGSHAISTLELLQVENDTRQPCVLTERQREVVRLTASGKRPQEIALILNVRPSTISNTLSQVYRKMGVSTAAELVLTCERRGWL